jgi:hypothetical protein
MSKVWRLAALAVAAIPGAASAGVTQSSAFNLPSNVAVTIGGGAANPDGSGLKSNTEVDIRTAAGDAKLNGTVTVNPSDPAQPADQTDRKFGLDSTLHGPAGASLTLQADSEAHDVRQEGVLMPSGIARSNATTLENSATAAVEVHPLEDVGVTAGISQSSTTTAQSNLPVAGAAQDSTVTTDDRQVFAHAQWAPFSFLSLNGGGKAETMQVASHGSTNADDQYRYTEPDASATAQLWDGANLKLSSEDAVAPVNTGDYTALAQAEGTDTALRIAPNREWRNQASLTQNFDGGVSASATATQAHIESTTELTLTAAGAVAPTSVADGSRRQLDANLTAPLSSFGLSDTSITAHATWRRSQIRDPLTGELRRVSGETPREANLRITQKDDTHHLTWGITGCLATAQNIYQPAEVTRLRTDSGVGAFVTFKPGDYVLSLNADGLVGGTRSQLDSLYAGNRAMGSVETIDRISDASPLVSFSLSRAF